MNALSDDVLIYMRDEEYLIWRGQELYMQRQTRKIFNYMLAHKGHWIDWEQLGTVLWPGEFPYTARAHLSNSAGRVASSLIGTSAWLERKPTYGYRLMGEIEVI